EAAPAGELSRDDLKALAVEGMETTIEAEPATFTLACSGTITGTVLGDAVEDAIAALSEWTGGNMVVDFHQGGELGGDLELIESVANGTVSMMQAAPTSQVTLVPELNVLDIGGLYKDVDGANTVLKNMYDKFAAAYEAKGIHLGAMYATDFRILTTNKPITTPDDLKGLNIRTQENKYHQTFWKALGANPTPLAFGELYLALQNGTVDAQENPPASIYGVKLYEVQNTITETNHIPFINTYLMNGALYNNLSDNQKKAIDQFFLYMERYQLAGGAQDDARMLKEFQNYGCTVSPVTDEVYAQFAVAADAVIEQMKGDGTVDPAFIDEYVNAARAQ
ncbi:MAG: TRAP transporter substrate-binding protein, partial [Lachnospiraceae bacterium]|nr:TRAP transporter substrate-binding protein [Lachnospiraceae bacterium]